MHSRGVIPLALCAVVSLLIGLAGVGVGVALAQTAAPKAAFPFVSSAEIDAALPRAAANPAAVARLLPDDGYQYFVATRTQAGPGEIHTQWSDVTTIRSGRGVLRTGRAITKSQEVSAGEWRGEAVQDPAERSIGAGDVVVIPAGMAHQLSPVGSDRLVYVTVKVPSSLSQR